MTGIISSNKGKYAEYGLIDASKDIMFTPDDSAQRLMDWVNPQIPQGDSILEPFKGNGAFYDKILDSNPKFYCEIDDGIDFFDYDKKHDWAISNPPFRVMVRGEDPALNYKSTRTLKKALNLPDGWVRLNAFIPIINRTMEICNKGFFYLVNHKLWSSLTVKRLKEWSEKGWVISAIMIIEISKWYGRYYMIKFEKNGKSLVDW